MLIVDDAILSSIVGAVADALIKRGVGLLKGDPEKKAFKAALAEALIQFHQEHETWVHELFDSGFLAGIGASVLAQAVMRDGPAPEELARAYANQFYRGAKGDPSRVQEVTPIAAEFLLLFDLALRRREVFRAHFNSRAMDKSAAYLYQLLKQANATWAQDRAKWIAESRSMLFDANETYRACALSLAKGKELSLFDLARARSAEGQAHINLVAVEYSERARLEAAFADLVTDVYASVEEECRAKRDPSKVLQQFENGYSEMKRFLFAAAPL